MMICVMSWITYKMNTMKPKHIGDGVYVSYDGYHIRLAVNHHENHVVALEPEVMEELIKYHEHIIKSREDQQSSMETMEGLEQ